MKERKALKKPPFFKWRLFLYIVLPIIHIIIFILQFYSKIFYFFIISEILLYIYLYKLKGFKKLLLLLIIVLVLLVMHILAIRNGKVLFENKIIRITLEGILNGVSKAYLFSYFFLFTANYFKYTKNELFYLISKIKIMPLLSNSLLMFMYLYDLFQMKLNKRTIIKLFITLTNKKYYIKNEIIYNTNNKTTKYLSFYFTMSVVTCLVLFSIIFLYRNTNI